MEKRGVASIAVIGGLIVFGIKVYAYLISGSIALLSDALESIVNIVASLLMFASVYISDQPADEDHQYGHQRIENISSLIEGGLVIIASIMIIMTAVNRIIIPVPLGALDLALGVSLISTALNGGISWMLFNKAKETNSLALEGDAKHLLSDVISSIGVVVGLFIADKANLPVLDPIIALGVSVIVMRMGVDMVYKAGQGLLDRSVPDVEEEIQKLLLRHESEFLDFHGLKTRRVGDKVYAEIHLSVDGSLSVKEAHDLTDHLEEDIRDELPEVNLTIHVEPPEKKK